MKQSVPAIWRHEDKYGVREVDLAILNGRLRGLLFADTHTLSKGYYHISSLYFDDWQNGELNRNIDGVDERTKYRIRRYENGSLFLEEKQKRSGLVHKESQPISEFIVARLASGGLLSFSEALTPAMRRFALLQRMERLRPAVIVDYDRTAYVCKTCSVRVTFDRHIAASSHVKDFLTAPPMTPVMENSESVLEVKYDGLLPAYIAQALRTGKMHTTAFSKYTMARSATLLPIRKGMYS